MRFAPKTEQEIQTMALLEPGIYQFQVSSAINEVSKSGNEMIKLSLLIWDKEGNTHHLYDYLLEAMAYKLRHFCETMGLINKYEQGELHPSDCIGKQGHIELVIQEGKFKDNGERYPNRNAVKDYIQSSGETLSHPVTLEDADVPF